MLWLFAGTCVLVRCRPGDGGGGEPFADDSPPARTQFDDIHHSAFPWLTCAAPFGEVRPPASHGGASARVSTPEGCFSEDRTLRGGIQRVADLLSHHLGCGEVPSTCAVPVVNVQAGNVGRGAWPSRNQVDVEVRHAMAHDGKVDTLRTQGC
jgi:hypothetical protein